MPDGTTGRVALLAAVLLAKLLLTTTAAAQVVPPEHYTLDPRGVDLVSGRFYPSALEVVIGQPGAGGMAYGRTYIDGQWFTNQLGTINTVGGLYVVSIGAISESFTQSGSNFISTSGNGSTLTRTGSTYAFTSSEGATAWFTTNFQSAGSPANVALITTYQAPNGERITYAWNAASLCMRDFDGNCMTYINVLRLQGVFNNLGYLIKYEYAYNGEDLEWGWNELVRVTGVNQAVEYCNPSAAVCTLTQPWPEVTYRREYVSGAMETVVEDVLGNETRYRHGGSSSQITAIRWPGSTSDNVAVAYDGQGRAVAVADASGTWTYSYADVSGVRTTTSTGPQSQQWVVVSDLGIGRATSVTDGLGRTTEYDYDTFGRLTTITPPEANEVRFTYDGRGNITEIRQVAEPGSSLADIVTTATYPATCANVLTCNQPSARTDPRGAVTDYTYDPNHGGVLTITSPAPITGADRPQTRVTYGSHYAWYKTSPSGSPVQAPTPVVLPTQISACATGATCTGTANEVRAVITYGASGVANNLLPTQISRGSGDGALTATEVMTYSPAGDVATVDGPLPGTADTTQYRYDAARRMVGTIGPDPDGAGPLAHRAVRVTYGPLDQPTLIERGTVAGYTDPNWAAFVSLQQMTAAYDNQGRLLHQTTTAGGTTYSVTQFSYDASGRPECLATRMNPATFGALPASACTLAASGAFGPDRLVRVAYDAASQLTDVTSAYGLTAARTESAAYTPNGRAETLTDGEGNLTTLEYDGHGRLYRIRYPLASNGSVSSTTDYEQYTYDAASNVTQQRRRDGQVFYFTYDALNRLTYENAPAPQANVARAYDNLGRLTYAGYGSWGIGFAYDALGRRTIETSPIGSMTSYYDLAGRRTELWWPDGYYAAYDYDVTGAMTAVRENGATSGVGVLATYTYDNLGRRVGISRGNAVATTFGYDPASRLTSLVQDLASTANDQTFTFTYNPAGQITSRTATNDAYAWNGHYNVDRTYEINGLNQITSAGAQNLTWDARGNLTSDGVGAWSYDASNRMVTAPSTTLTYDPVGRLYQTASPVRRYLYDGSQIVGEYNSSFAVLRRYVPGPAPDEYAVWYEGASTLSRRWPITDQLGSLIAAADGNGNAVFRNRYDEYGVPAATNSGLFQYTGQMWLPQAGVYHYRARAYHAGLGRFMQPDPLGYVDGLNLYAYVSNDAINYIDPFGTTTTVPPVAVDCNIHPCRPVCPPGWRCIGPDGTDVTTTPTTPTNPPDELSPGDRDRLDEICRRATDRVNQTQGALAESFRARVWNNVEALRFELGRFAASANTGHTVAYAFDILGGLGLGGSALQERNMGGRLAAGLSRSWLGATALVAGQVFHASGRDSQARAAALQARLDQILACGQ